MSNQASPSNRPGTLAQALRLGLCSGDALRGYIVGFLDEFYADPDSASRRARVEEAPGLTGDGRQDAFVGAIGEHLCHRWNLGQPPAWTDDPARFLSRPWFIGPERMKAFLLAESPSAFRRRFIFTEIEPLRRASMPKDGRWWAYETMRTGRIPQPGEIEPSAGDAAVRP